MTYQLKFSEKAAREWNKLHPTLRSQFEKILVRRLEAPAVPSARLRGRAARYKIKLKTIGYRLVYEIREGELIVLVIAVGRRDSIYDAI